MQRLNLEYASRWKRGDADPARGGVNLFAENDSTAVPIAGYAYACRVEHPLPAVFVAGGVRYTLAYVGDRRAFVVLAEGDSVLTLPVDELIERTREHRGGGRRGLPGFDDAAQRGERAAAGVAGRAQLRAA